jgi:hypothetical protein
MMGELPADLDLGAAWGAAAAAWQYDSDQGLGANPVSAGYIADR